jgi:uncharacterized membrane protein YqjE
MNKEGKELLSPKPWFIREAELDLEQREIRLEKQKAELEEQLRNMQRQDRVLMILTLIFTALIVFSLVIILLNGFGIGGFQIDTTTLNLLAGSTIAEVAGLLAIALRGIFKRTHN